MKKLKPNQLGPWCTYCRAKVSRATHRQDGFGGKFSCGNHTPALQDEERTARDREARMTEADYQTWDRL